MALDVFQSKGCYVSSSLPKALYVPEPSSYYKSKRDNLHSAGTSYFKPRKKLPVTGTNSPSSINYENPVAGRQHLSVQTDIYLEELCDVIEEADAQTETDPWLDRPSSPLFVPASSGIDKSTQIYPGDLFDFDAELETVLDDLVEDTIEQALMEVMTEEKSKAPSGSNKNSAESKVKRRTEVEKELDGKEDKGEKEEEKTQLEEEVSQKVLACIFSQSYLSELIPQVYKKLESDGYFESDDSDMQEIEENFWPWLLDEVDTEIETLEASCQLLDNLIEDSIQNISGSDEPKEGSRENSEIHMLETPQAESSNISPSAH